MVSTTIHDLSSYQFNPNSQLGLFLVEKSKIQVEQKSIRITEVISAVLEIIDQEKLYDPTNWEVIFLNKALSTIFGRGVVCFETLIRDISRMVSKSRCLVKMESPDEPAIIKAPWATAHSKPVIQTAVEHYKEFPLDKTRKYFLSEDLLDIYRLMGKGYPNNKRFSFLDILMTVYECAASDDKKDCCDGDVLHTRNNVLFQLADSNTLCNTQLRYIVAFHCKKYPFGGFQKECGYCEGHHLKPCRDALEESDSDDSSSMPSLSPGPPLPSRKGGDFCNKCKSQHIIPTEKCNTPRWVFGN